MTLWVVLRASQTINMTFMNHFRIIQHAFLLSFCVQDVRARWAHLKINSRQVFLSFPMSRWFFSLLCTFLKVIKPVFFVLSPSFFFVFVLFMIIYAHKLKVVFLRLFLVSRNARPQRRRKIKNHLMCSVKLKFFNFHQNIHVREQLFFYSH